MSKFFFLLTFIFAAQSASAQYFNNRAVVQGYLKQGTTALNDTAGFPMRFIVKRGTTEVWCQTSSSSVPVVNGVFNVVLSGNANCDSLTAALSPSVFSHTANTDTFTFDVVVDILKDGFGGADDATFAGIDIVSSPMAMYANAANSALTAVTATNATNATNATTATTATTAGNVTGTVALANGGTGATTAAAARAALGLGSLATVNTSGVATQYLKGDGTWGTPASAPVTSVAGRTGAVTLTTADVSGLGTSATMTATAFAQSANNLSDLADAATARGNLNAAAKGANTDITSVALTGAGTALAVTNNATIGGTLTVTGTLSANLTGNVTGNLTGVARQASSRVALATTGSGTAYVLTNTVGIATGPVAGTMVSFKFHTTNTGAATLNVDGTGAKSLFSKRRGVAVSAGDLVSGSFVTAVYDGTNWVVDIPDLYFTASSLSCGTSVTANQTANCTAITAANVNAGDLVQCSPSADPNSKVQWSAFATAGSITIRVGCNNNTSACTMTAVNWKCIVMK
ncbi:MAG: hypothetical protein JSU04_19220 [Bdellovibrionales bacterium]|nr:hypothetical protein [Bdellovibrionales bacterium]